MQIDTQQACWYRCTPRRASYSISDTGCDIGANCHAASFFTLRARYRTACVVQNSPKKRLTIARPGRPRTHDPLGDDINRAIRQRDQPMLQSLITNATVNIQDSEARTLSFAVIIEKSAYVISWLIEKSADVNHHDRNGWTANCHAGETTGNDWVKVNGRTID